MVVFGVCVRHVKAKKQRMKKSEEMRKIFIFSLLVILCGENKSIVKVPHERELRVAGCTGKVNKFSNEIINFSAGEKLRIPERVIHCYRGNLSEPWMPQTLSTVIEIIRKIETRRSTGSDLRHLSARLFHE